jgi:hypothetical protein
MANKSTSMLQIKKALQLLEEGRSERYISSQLKLSRNTLRGYQSKFHCSGLAYDQLLLLSDSGLASIVYGEPRNQVKSSRQDRFELLIDYFTSELKRVGVTRQLLWKEYLEKDPDGYGYSQFCERLNQLKSRNNNTLTMHFEHCLFQSRSIPVIQSKSIPFKINKKG